MEPPSETEERDTLDSLRRRGWEESEGSPPTTSRAEDHEVALLWLDERTFRSLTWELELFWWLLRDEVLDLGALEGMGPRDYVSESRVAVG